MAAAANVTPRKRSVEELSRSSPESAKKALKALMNERKAVSTHLKKALRESQIAEQKMIETDAAYKAAEHENTLKKGNLAEQLIISRDVEKRFKDLCTKLGRDLDVQEAQATLGIQAPAGPGNPAPMDAHEH